MRNQLLEALSWLGKKAETLIKKHGVVLVVEIRTEGLRFKMRNEHDMRFSYLLSYRLVDAYIGSPIDLFDNTIRRGMHEFEAAKSTMA